MTDINQKKYGEDAARRAIEQNRQLNTKDMSSPAQKAANAVLTNHQRKNGNA